MTPDIFDTEVSPADAGPPPPSSHQVLPSSSLGLEDDDDDDDDDRKELQPRRFLRLPSGHLLAYGGNNGHVTCLLEDDDNDVDGTKQNTKKDAKFVLVQQYDDGVRAMAVSQDGKRLAVGLADGTSKIYVFDDYSVDNDNTDDYVGRSGNGGMDDHTKLHPFIRKGLLKELKKRQKAKADQDDPLADDNDDDDDDIDEFNLSQSFQPGMDLECFAGPSQNTPIRDLVFLPTTQAAWDGENRVDFDDQYMLAIASESGLVVISATSDDDKIKSSVTSTSPLVAFQEQVKEHHDHGGLRGLAVHKDDDDDDNDDDKNSRTVLATLAMDGRLCLWDINKGVKKAGDEEHFLLHRETTMCVPTKDVGEIHDADVYERSCRPTIQGHVIATPGKLVPVLRTLQGNKVSVLDEDTFKTTSDGDHGEMRHLESTVALLFCSGTTLITSGRDGRLIFWKAARDSSEARTTWTVMEMYQVKSPATDLCIHNKQLFAASADGVYQTIDVSKYIQKAKNVTKSAVRKNDFEASTIKLSSKRIQKKDSQDDDDDDDVDFGGENKASSDAPTAVKGVRFVDDEAQDDDDDDDQIAITDGGVSRTSGISEMEDANLDDMDDPQKYRPSMMMGKGYPMNFPQPQSPFSPSSTPLDLARRYLCWNHHGSAIIRQGDDRHNTIAIHFTDALIRPVNFTDKTDYILGSIGEDGAIFASDLKGDDDEDDDDMEGLEDFNMSERTKLAVRRDRQKGRGKNGPANPMGSTVYFHRFNTFASIGSKDWSVSLPDGERAVGAATGAGWASVVTSRRFLRFFSSGGNQAQIVWLEGEPVCMAGRGRFLAVFYHKSMPLMDGTQQLGYTLWDAGRFHVVAQGSAACLSKGSSLRWVGFSNDFSLVAMDSDGMLSMLAPAAGLDTSSSSSWAWTPVLDTVGLRKSADDRHWPVTVYDGKLVCIPLKGGNTYPDATRRPVTTTLGLRMPLARSVVAKTATLEEVSVRSNLALDQKKFITDTADENIEELQDEYDDLCKGVDKVTIKLFAALVDAGKLESALDLMGRLHLEKSFDVCIKYSDRLGHTKLADYIVEEKDHKFPPLVVEEEIERDEEEGGYGNYASDGNIPASSSFATKRQIKISPDSKHIQKPSKRSRMTEA